MYGTRKENLYTKLMLLKRKINSDQTEHNRWRQTEIPFFNGLSRKQSFLMRHSVSRSFDGSASLEDVANHFQVSPIAIATASLPSEDGKRRMLLFETVVKGHQERRISALGGHGFAVFSPPGHWPISKTETSLFQMLIHEMNNASEIQSSLWDVTLWRSKLYGFTTRRLQEEGGCPRDHQFTKSGSDYCKWV